MIADQVESRRWHQSHQLFDEQTTPLAEPNDAFGRRFHDAMSEAVPTWARRLADAAGLHDTEAEQLRRLGDLCEQDGLEGEAREAAVTLLAEAMATERQAVKVLEEAVKE